MSNENRTVLITGASGGLGSAIARDLYDEGFKLALHCRSNRQSTEALQKEIDPDGTRTRILQFDVSDREACKEILTADVKENGGYYGVVCNAGLHRDGPFPALKAEDWDTVMDVNLDAFYNILHPTVMPMLKLRDGGRIVTIASVSGVIGNRGQVNYSAAKAGLIGATKALAIELAKRNVTVNCVAPGLIQTEMVEDVNHDHIMQLVPMQRMGQAFEVAGLVRFLFTEPAGYITRQVISINGGIA